MIERLSESLAIKIKKANEEETASVAVLKFAITGLVQNIINILLILIISALFGYFYEGLIAFCAFMLLRIFAGGHHFKSATLCTVVSVISIVVIPPLAGVLPAEAILYINLASLAITLVFAPSNIKKTRIKPSWRPVYKGISVLIIAVNFILQSPIIAVSFLFQAVSTIDIQRRTFDAEKTG